MEATKNDFSIEKLRDETDETHNKLMVWREELGHFFGFHCFCQMSDSGVSGLIMHLERVFIGWSAGCEQIAKYVLDWLKLPTR